MRGMSTINFEHRLTFAKHTLLCKILNIEFERYIECIHRRRDMIKVGITEIDIGYEDKEYAREHCLEVMQEAYENGVELLVFPEMTLTGFTMMPARMWEAYRDGEIPESVSFFMENSRKYDMAMAFGYIEAFMADGSGEFDESRRKVFENKLAIVSGDEVIMDYAKIHPFSFSGEDRVYRAGSHICQANVKDLRLGGYICYDLRFPEIFSAARDSYDAILVIANWPEERVAQWEALLRARTIENQAYVIGVNRVGMGKRERYVPSSHIYDVYGNEMAERVSDRLLVAELDPAVIAGARKTFPQGRDRKNEFYMSIL
jgi:omega-amidase